MPYRLYSGTVGEDKSEIEAIKARIAAACPDVRFESGDYGLSLYAYLTFSDTHATVVLSVRCVCRPARPADAENGFEGQSEIVSDVDSLIKFWSA